MKKISLLIIILLIATSCASKKVVVTNDALVSVPKEVEKSDLKNNPAEFVKSIPESAIIRKSLIHFENTYSRVYADDNVINAAASDKIIGVIKPLEIGFTMPSCSGLVLDKNFNEIWISGYNTVVFNSSQVDFYSAFDCARYATYKKAFNKGPAIILGRYIVEWNGSKLVMRDAFNSAIIFNGDVGGNVVAAGMIKDNISVVLDTNYIMAYNDKINAFAILGKFPLNFEYLAYSDKTFYGILKTGEFFTITDTETNITKYKNCTLSATSPYAMCDGIVTNGKVEYKGLPKSNNFSVGLDFYVTINNSNLNIYSLKPSWQRFVAFQYNMPTGCRDKKGDLYFTGFSGKNYKISQGKESVVNKIPDKCNKKNVALYDGKFYCNRKICGTFATISNHDTTSVMYQRKEGEKIYFYFEEITNKKTTLKK